MASSDERLGAVVEEAVAALRWISTNTTDLPADFPNGSVRLRQVANRANEALRDIEHLRSKVNAPVLQEETWSGADTGCQDSARLGSDSGAQQEQHEALWRRGFAAGLADAAQQEETGPGSGAAMAQTLVDIYERVEGFEQ